MEEIADRLDGVWQRIIAAAKGAGRSVDSIELIAVTKTHPAEAVREALDAGQDVFGESRVQEALAKIPLLPSRCRWHFIGHLQKNKIRKALASFELFHGVDSLELARDIQRIASEEGLFPRLLLEVNIAGETTKFGFPPDRLEQEIEEVLALDRLQIEGLMGMAPIVEKPGGARPYFAKLRKFRDRLAERAGCPLNTLSMGMSGDFEDAIAEGSTLVRVGSAIFGDRRKLTAQ